MSPGAFLENVTGQHPWLTRLGSFACGALLMLSFAPVGWYPLAFVLVAPLLYAFHVLPRRTAAQLGFAFGAGLFLTGTYWLYVSIHVFGQAPLALAVFLMLGLVVIMAFYYAAAGWMISHFTRGRVLHFVVIAPAVWVVLEWLRGWFLSGFPWMTLGYSQIDSPLAAFAPVGGIYFVSLILLVGLAALIGASLSAGRQRWLLLVAAVVPWPAGLALDAIEWTERTGPALRASIVQGGVSQDRKWLPEQFLPTLDLYRGSLNEHGDSQLIVWPEVAIPTVLDRVEEFVSVLQDDLAIRNTTLLFGILERDATLEHVYNSVVAIDGSRRQVYRKRHLVPFGEYFPVPDFVREWMRLMNLPHSDLSAGDAEQPLIVMPDGNRLSVAICYEDAYAAEQLYAIPEATLLINVSNDAWFGDSIAPHQHLQIARMRALEVGRYVVRATNNGISAFIGPRGEILATGPQFEYAALSRDVYPMSGATPYARIGNWPVVLFCIALLLLAGRDRLRTVFS